MAWFLKRSNDGILRKERTRTVIPLNVAVFIAVFIEVFIASVVYQHHEDKGGQARKDLRNGNNNWRDGMEKRSKLV